MLDIYYVGKADEETKFYMKKYRASRLLSYVLDKKEIIKSINDDIPIFMDSGAYSAFTKGKKIDIDEYIDFINTYGDKIKIIASLDVIYDAESSFKNFEYIYSKINYKDKLVPCFHLGEPISYLDKYINDERVKYIAIGGIVADKRNQTRNAIEGIVNYIRNRNKNIKIHLFGVTRTELFNGLDITSVDSSTWIRYSIYGNIIDPITSRAYHFGNRNKLKVEEYSEFITEETKEILNELQITLEELVTSSGKISIFNLISLQKYIEKNFNKTGINKKTKLF